MASVTGAAWHAAVRLGHPLIDQTRKEHPANRFEDVDDIFNVKFSDGFRQEMFDQQVTFLLRKILHECGNKGYISCIVGCKVCYPEGDKLALWLPVDTLDEDTLTYEFMNKLASLYDLLIDSTNYTILTPARDEKDASVEAFAKEMGIV